MADGSLVAFVSRSTVRTEVTRALAAGPRSAAALVADLPASRSGVYKALDELSGRDLVSRAGEESWTLTGPGRIVADELDRHRWLDRLLADRDYWLTHDLSGLPERFRRRLPVLRDADVLRNPHDHPNYLERHWVELMPEADRLWVGTRVVSEPYADATDEQAGPDVETRLLIHAPLLDRFLERQSVTPGEFASARPEDVEERVCRLPCSFMLTGELFTLSLPLDDGRYDRDTELVCRDEAALRFGEDLVTYYWERATPVETYLAD